MARSETSSINKEPLDEVLERIVDVASPEKVILFGSAARGEMGPDSDIDLLVIVPDGSHRGHLTEEIYMKLIGVRQAVDVVVVTESDVEQYGDSHPLVIKRALSEGEVIYDASRTVSAG